MQLSKLIEELQVIQTYCPDLEVCVFDDFRYTPISEVRYGGGNVLIFRDTD